MKQTSDKLCQTSIFDGSLLKKSLFVSVIAMSVLISACSSDDDGAAGPTTTDAGGSDAGGSDAGGSDAGGTDAGGTDAGGTDGGSELNPNLQTVSIMLDSTSTVPPANVDGASGTGSFSVDTETGAIAGSVTVSGTTGTPTMAHIHSGAAGEAGPVVVNLEANEDSSVWSVPEGEALDAAGIELFNAGNLYVNVHTEANAPGELRSQLVDGDVAAPGSVTITFRNTSVYQPMTPPVVALHNAPDAAENPIRLFEVGQPASGDVILIAEDGNFTPLADVATGQISAGTVSAAGVAVPEVAGPLMPGDSSSITLQLEAPDQVLSVVSMVVCTNDGFTGVDSRPLSSEATETFLAPIYDAGSETNVQMLNYWVPPCGGPAVDAGGNIGDDENGAITLHPGQAEAENPIYNFESGTEWLEITVTRN